MSVSDAIAVLPTTFNALRLCRSSQVRCWPSPQLLGFVIDNLYERGRSSKLIGDKFEVGQCTEARPSPGSCKHKLRTPNVVDQERFLLGTDLKKASTTTRLMTASSNKTLDVDPQSVLPAASVSYMVHVPRRAEKVDEAMPSFENEEKSRKSPRD
ncbi:hypothetical protein HID58_075444 [Brassica napus]|uniref:Uncharacterized protein n=1 Tax=Brassica napus TaxID=3708 RepID=A0ABQ7YLA8_BRANA|nr:hypothetical protein HID58_075444 [Brassica napus]